MSQRMLAIKSQVGEDTISRLEGSRHDPRPLTLVALSFGLQVPLTLLLMGCRI
jgi:hypothetical protein